MHKLQVYFFRLDKRIWFIQWKEMWKKGVATAGQLYSSWNQWCSVVYHHFHCPIFISFRKQLYVAVWCQNYCLCEISLRKNIIPCAFWTNLPRTVGLQWYLQCGNLSIGWDTARCAKHESIWEGTAGITILKKALWHHRCSNLKMLSLTPVKSLDLISELSFYNMRMTLLRNLTWQTWLAAFKRILFEPMPYRKRNQSHW